MDFPDITRSMLRVIYNSLCYRYREGIDLLYSSNTPVTLDLYDTMTLPLLPFTLLPHRLNTIRSLRVYWDLYNHPPLPLLPGCSGPSYQELVNRQIIWTTLWHIISEMESLENLEVKLIVSFEWHTLNKESAEILLAPIKRVARPKTFVLSLPFPAMVEGMAAVTIFISGATKGWEGSDPWDDLNCTV